MVYGESSATKAKQSSKGGKPVKEDMGMWLSLLPPGVHCCSVCKKRFKSLQALGGHQNAHRTRRIQIEMNNVDPIFFEDEKERRTGGEVPMVVANDHSVVANYEDRSRIDLNLYLGFRPHKKVIKFFDFMPFKEMKAYGVGEARELLDLSPRIGGGDIGVGVVSVGSLPKASVSNGENGGKGGKKKFSTKKGVDLTLKM